jgi:hypothetical protein
MAAEPGSAATAFSTRSAVLCSCASRVVTRTAEQSVRGAANERSDDRNEVRAAPCSLSF